MEAREGSKHEWDEERICIQCQECCKWMTFILDPPDQGMSAKYLEFYSARGCDVTITPEGKVAVMVPSVCPRLNSVIGCEIYRDRPLLCKQYDGRHDPFMRHRCRLPVTPVKEAIHG